MLLAELPPIGLPELEEAASVPRPPEGSVRARGYDRSSMCAQAVRERSALYSDWLADFQRRLSQHDRGVRALAEDIADRTRWRGRARNTPGFEPPGQDLESGPDILCVRRGR